MNALKASGNLDQFLKSSEPTTVKITTSSNVDNDDKSMSMKRSNHGETNTKKGTRRISSSTKTWRDSVNSQNSTSSTTDASSEFLSNDLDQTTANLIQVRAMQSKRFLLGINSNNGRSSNAKVAAADAWTEKDKLALFWGDDSDHGPKQPQCGQRLHRPSATTKTDDGEDQPYLPQRLAAAPAPPKRGIRAHGSSITSASDVQTLCEEEFEHSKFGKKDRMAEIPKFQLDEIILGRVLGKGGFGTVYEVRGIVDILGAKQKKKSLGSTSNHSNHSLDSLNEIANGNDDGEYHYGRQVDEEDKKIDNMDMQSRNFIAEHCLRTSKVDIGGGESSGNLRQPRRRRSSSGFGSSEARYALKRLSRDILVDDDKRLQGMADMVRETHFLVDIQHPNIVKLRAVAFGDQYDDKYFIVMDRLYDTLMKRLEKWKKAQKSFKGFVGKLFLDRTGQKRAKHKEAVMMACFELSSALSYLHKKGIIHRDLKPDNIGFDIRGDLKLFDLGLAKEIPDEGADEDGCYNFTQMCGTPRYMSPEVAWGEPYNESCDVYSFTLLCWQMMSLKVPYENCTMRSLRRTVWNRPHVRPTIEEEWPAHMKKLLFVGWSNRIKDRPDMKYIESILAREVGKFDTSFDLRSHILRRKSTFIMRRAESFGHRTANLSPKGNNDTWPDPLLGTLPESNSDGVLIERGRGGLQRGDRRLMIDRHNTQWKQIYAPSTTINATPDAGTSPDAPSGAVNGTVAATNTGADRVAPPSTAPAAVTTSSVSNNGNENRSNNNNREDLPTREISVDPTNWSHTQHSNGEITLFTDDDIYIR